MAKIPQNLESSGGTREVLFLQYITSGVVLVLFVGFIAIIIAYITLLIDVQNQKQSYKDLSNQLDRQKIQQALIYKQLEQNGIDLSKMKTYFGIK